ncbi:hypothetical protein [Pyrodictium abyssi]|uniref:Uncharacterized protein n=1 Tax=Pyrodictium abyssi TaxID=54256 RepID=A0ABM8IV68_9CREN|nr:hypothetical protein PABY_10200 [Pyrodictium abyssi]
MAFAAGFLLLTPHYRDEPKRREVKQYLENLGFELYEVGKQAFIVFYVEAPNPKALEDVIKMAEQHDGVAKAYIAFGFMGDDAVREWINDALARGELELDESTKEYIRGILAKIAPDKLRAQSP